MGVWGWNFMQDQVVVEGRVYGRRPDSDERWLPHAADGSHGDSDWCVFVEPDPGYGWVLTNPSGDTNTNGLIECEVQPRDRLPNGDNPRIPAVARKYLAGLENQRVTVVGTLVRDRSHSYAYEDIGLTDNSDRGKTELHPLSGIFREVPLVNWPGVRRFEVFALADDSDADRPKLPSDGGRVPFTQESRTVAFQVPLEAGGTLIKVHEIDDADEARIELADAPVGPGGAMAPALKIGIRTGPTTTRFRRNPDRRAGRRPAPLLIAPKGFYWGVWDVRWPGALDQPSAMTVAYEPRPVPVDAPVTLTFTATDAASGAPIPDASVALNGIPTGVTGTPFTQTFPSITEHRWIVDSRGKPHRITTHLKPAVRVEVHKAGYNPSWFNFEFLAPEPHTLIQ
jgi:hypothetical protein